MYPIRRVLSMVLAGLVVAAVVVGLAEGAQADQNSEAAAPYHATHTLAFPLRGENLALGKPYTMTSAPNYTLCIDPGDAAQLTDGKYVPESWKNIWTHTETVGWQGVPVFITIDLGQVYPLKGVTYHTAAGIAGVTWPSHLLLFVSEEGNRWYSAGDLVELDAKHGSLPDYSTLATHLFWTDELKTHARYVQIGMPEGIEYYFVDEIEVHRGDEAWLQRPYEGEPLVDVPAYVKESYAYLKERQGTPLAQAQRKLSGYLEAARGSLAQGPAEVRSALEAEVRRLEAAISDLPTVPMADLPVYVKEIDAYVKERQGTTLVQAQLGRDLEAARASVARAPAEARGALEAETRRLEKAVANMATVPMEGFRAVLPMLPVEREIFRLQAMAWRAQGKPALRVWTNCRWDPLQPGQEPPAGAAAPQVEVRMMKNEYRAGVFNLTNAEPGEQQVYVRVKGLPGGDNPGYLRMHEVLSVGTRRFAVSSALPEATRSGGDWVVSVPSGMTRQVWLSFHPKGLPTGTHAGRIELRRGNRVVGSLPLRLQVFPVRFPDQTALLMGGWEYTNCERYGVPGADLTPTNRLALVQHLREHYLNAPWAGSQALPPGSYDAEGKLVTPPDTSNFDQWTALWPEARRWMVVAGGYDSFEGSPVGTPLFNTKVGNWAHFWARHLRERGFSPRQLCLLLVDEASTQAQYDLIVAWGRAIKAAEPELVLWEDVTFRDGIAPPDPDMLSVCDVLCPNRDLWNSPRIHKEPYQQQQQAGKELWLYNCDGPAHNFDPYAYYLMQEWQCFRIGARGTAFWSFMDSGGVSGWNEYPGQRTGYTPLYLDEASVTGSKQMEAIREGIQDYEYLTMLRARVEELAKRGVAEAKLARARRLLETACDRVLAQEKWGQYGWDLPKDRTLADVVRVEILQALTDLGKVRVSRPGSGRAA